MSKTEMTSETIEIPFNEIRLPDFNCRTALEGIEELWESIKTQGLHTPLTVMKDEAGIWLVSGFRRHAALKLGRVGAGLVLCVVKSFKNDAQLHLANLVENVRDDVHPADLARRLSELEDGSYPRVIETAGEALDAGEGKLERVEIAQKTGLSKSHIGNLIRIHNKVSDDIQKAWRKLNIPLTLIIKWASLPEEDQAAALEEWKAEEAEKRANGGKRKKRGAAAESEEEESEEEESGDEGDGEKLPSKAVIRDRLAQLKESAEEAKGQDAHFLKGVVKGLRWVTGEIKRL